MVDHVNPKITVAPLVAVSILDHHTRRDFKGEKEDEAQHQVMGALLGGVVEGTIEIRTAFPMRMTQKEDAEKKTTSKTLDLQFMKDMLALNQKIYPNDRIVGWYCTGYDPATHRAIQDYFRKSIKNIPAVGFFMDPTLANESLNPKCFVMTSATLGGHEIPSLFKEVPFKWKCRSDIEKLAMDTMIINRHRPLACKIEGLPQQDQLATADLQSCAKRPAALSFSARDAERANFDQVHKHLLQVQAVLKKALDYTNAVIEGKEAENSQVGRDLLALVQSMPPVATETFDQLFNSTTQDLLMVNYLAKLTQTQVHLMERLHVYVPDLKPNPRNEGERNQ